MAEKCPQCGSDSVVKLNRGAKVGGVVGAAGGLAARGAGAAAGAAAGSVVPGIGTAIGAVAGFFLVGSAAAATGALAGKALDDSFLDNRQCLTCDFEWHED